MGTTAVYKYHDVRELPYRTFTLVFPLTYFPMLISGPDITLRKTSVFHSKLQYVLFIGKLNTKYPVLLNVFPDFPICKLQFYV